jgi:hypothetical protein
MVINFMSEEKDIFPEMAFGPLKKCKNCNSYDFIDFTCDYGDQGEGWQIVFLFCKQCGNKTHYAEHPGDAATIWNSLNNK